GAAGGPGGADDGLAVVEAAQVVPLRGGRARNVQPHRVGAGRDQQRAERCRAAVLEAQTLCGGVESRDTRPEAQLDALLLVVLGPAERNPVLLGCAGQVVLRQVGPIDWWI